MASQAFTSQSIFLTAHLFCAYFLLDIKAKKAKHHSSSNFWHIQKVLEQDEQVVRISNKTILRVERLSDPSKMGQLNQSEASFRTLLPPFAEANKTFK